MATKSKNKKERQDNSQTRVAARSRAVRVRPDWYRQEWFLGLVLILAVIVTYVPVWQAGFVWDDDFHLTKNPCIIGPNGFVGIWTTHKYQIFPLVISTFWLEHALWGLAPLPYHLVNVALQAGSAVVLWQVLKGLQVPGAWLGAALWALHPMQVESVAWISEMKNTESGLFYLLAILFFVRWLKENEAGEPKEGPRDYALCLLFAALAMASKSSTVVLPAVLFLCAWWVEGRWPWRHLGRLAPIFLMSVIATAVTIWPTAPDPTTFTDPHAARSWPERVATSGDVFWFYLGKLLWPYPLMAVYPRWQIDAGQFVSWLPLLAAMLVGLGLWFQRESRLFRPCFFALAYFVVVLLPFLGLIEQSFWRYSFVEDHLQYLACMGPLALVGAGLTWLGKRVLPARPGLEMIPGAALLLALGLLSWQQAETYQNEQTLWTDNLSKNPGAWQAYDGLGNYLFFEGKFSESMALYQKALGINSTNPETHYDLALALKRNGRLPESVTQYQAALQIDPDYEAAHSGLGSALAMEGEDGQAIDEYQKALQLAPNISVTHYNLGLSLERKQRVDEALAQFQKAVEIEPNYADAHFCLGLALTQKGQIDGAIDEFQKSLRINPNNPDAHDGLGNALMARGRAEEAVAEYKEAIRLNPDSVRAQTDLAKAQAKVGGGS